MVRHLVVAAYGQVHMGPPDVDMILDPARPAELVQVTEDRRGLIILTGIADGGVWMTIAQNRDDGSLTGEENTESSIAWDEWQEVTMEIHQPLYLSAPTVDCGVGGPVFTPPAPGEYRVTVRAWGRSAFRDMVMLSDDNPPERYVIHIESAAP